MSDNRLHNIEQKLDAVIGKLHEMNITLAENTKSLIIHEKRTDIAEQKIELLNQRIDDAKDRENEQYTKLDEKITPIKNHVEVLDKTFNILWKVVIPAIAGVFALLYKIGAIHFK